MSAFWRRRTAAAAIAAVVSGGALGSLARPDRSVPISAYLAAAQQPPGESPADQALRLRTNFEELLGQHVVLSARLTRSPLRGATDLAQQANDALVRNTQDISAMVTSVYGQAAGAAFRPIWTSQEIAQFNYARAVAAHDAAGQSAARQVLASYVQSISDYLQRTTRGAVPAAAVRPAVQTHVDLVLRQVDAYAAGNYRESYRLELEDYKREFGLGKLIAGAIAGQGRPLPPAFDSPQRRLESALGAALGLHAELVVETTRSGLNNSPDFSAASAALDSNTRDLAAAMASLFGPAAGQRFMSLWADHIDDYMAYTAAVAAHDEIRRNAAISRLNAFKTSFASYLSSATEGKLTSPALAAAFAMHDSMLTRQVDAYSDRDYTSAFKISYDSYQQMFGLAQQVSTAVGATIAARLPSGVVRTGGGGMASVVSRR